MFYNIGEFGDLELHLTSVPTAIDVRQKIPFLYVRTIICCARAMKAIARKRERVRPLLGNKIMPFGFSYNFSLSKFRQHRREFVSPTRRGAEKNAQQKMAQPETIWYTQPNENFLKIEEPKQQRLFEMDREKIVLDMERKLEIQMW